MYPYPSYNITAINVNPGDTITAEVRWNSGYFTLSMADGKQSFSINVSARSVKRSSAEWIVEAPWMGGVLPLADFTPVTFTNCSASVNSVTGPISNSPAWQDTFINMVGSSGLKGLTGGLNGGGDGFKVTWKASR